MLCVNGRVQHAFREANCFADLLANQVVNGIFDTEAMGCLTLDKSGILANHQEM